MFEESEKQLTIIMYHYIRDLKNSKYPNIKGLEINGFIRQLEYLMKEYTIICADQLIGYINGEIKNLPKKPCLLTFDDGYKDHIDYVLPELKKRHLKGCFFPPAKPIKEKIPLDVNSIHYILASTNNSSILYNDLLKLCLSKGITNDEISVLWEKCAQASRFDSKEVIFIKRMLQRELDENTRNSITKDLFFKYVKMPLKDFCQELYMSIDDLKVLIREGMYVGNHSYNHYWLNAQDRDTQLNEINNSLKFLNEIGAPTKNWIMCYPYGAYNDITISILKNFNCLAGFTTKVGIAKLNKNNFFELSRYDTNDFPQ